MKAMDRRDIVARLTTRASRSTQDLRDEELTDELTGLAATRAQSIQRLQFGISGLVLMFLLVGLASLVERRADAVDAVAVPEAAPTVEPNEPSAASDPLVTAGVVPDLPDEPEPAQESLPELDPPAPTPGE
jgi:hypothetical protein